MGYHRAGFEVVGVDNKPQKNYPFEFHQSEYLEYLMAHGREFDLIHSSPPCQGYSKARHIHHDKIEYQLVIEDVRERLIKIGVPYVIENVVGAPLVDPIMLCGLMFGLRVIRHRYFESSMFLLSIPHPSHQNIMTKSYGKGNYSSFKNGATHITVGGHNYCRKDGAIAMGIDWMTTRDELSQAIPPVYTEWFGQQIIANEFLMKGGTTMIDLTHGHKAPPNGSNITENDVGILRHLIERIPADNWDNYMAKALLAYTQAKVKDDQGKETGEYMNTHFSLGQRNQLNQLSYRYPIENQTETKQDL
jgi:DNA (cytosine-5)-methyltransferase 1